MAEKVFITGISSGIGRATTEALINNGYHVIGTVRKESDRKELMSRYTANFNCLICDLADDQQINHCADEVKRLLRESHLYGIINNAGIAIPGPMHLVPDEDFFRQLNINVIATRKMTNKLISLTGKTDTGMNAKIVFISSISGILASPFNGPYCVSKHALECLVDIYRRELRYLDIDVVSILPGPIKTKIWQKASGKFEAYKKGPFREIAEKADKMIENTEKQALDVSYVTELIVKILSRAENKNRYIIHKKALMLRLLAYLAPSSMVDKLIWKNLDRTDAKSYRPA